LKCSEEFDKNLHPFLVSSIDGMVSFVFRNLYPRETFTRIHCGGRWTGSIAASCAVWKRKILAPACCAITLLVSLYWSTFLVDNVNRTKNGRFLERYLKP
jgi:hypothetical protein